jgi:hypothetical protein
MNENWKTKNKLGITLFFAFAFSYTNHFDYIIE